MKIESKLVMINVKNSITVGANDAITLDVIHQVCLYENKDGSIEADLDLVDYDNIKFLGMEIENGYKGFRDFKEQMLKFGINVDELIDEECVGLISNLDMIKLKLMY
tara:strand:+ start:277 stop:597 length:321 start_codon:yes stop_codon:yes gene_type:complete